MWLSRSSVEETIRDALGGAAERGHVYAPWLTDALTVEEVTWIEAQFAAPVGRAQRRRKDFTVAGTANSSFERSAIHADGVPTRPAAPLPSEVEDAVAKKRRACPDWRPRQLGLRRDAWFVLLAGRLHCDCALSIETIAVRLQRSPATVARAVKLHKRMLADDEEYRCQVISHHVAAAAT